MTSSTDENESAEWEGQMMDPDPLLSAAEVKSNNQLAAGMPKAGGGWQESVNDHTATMVGDDK